MKFIKVIIKRELFYYYFLGLGAIFVLFLFTFRLSSLNVGINKFEISSINASSGLNVILSNSINLPYKISTYLSSIVYSHHIFLYRFMSVIWALFFIYLFYLVIKKKFGPNIATILAILLMCSAWILHVSRSAVPDVMYLSTILIFWFRDYLRVNRNLNRIFLILVSILVFYLYTPGMIWIGLIGILWQREVIKELLSRIDRKFLILIGIYGIILLIPLIYSIVNNPSHALSILGIPTSKPNLLVMIETFFKLPYNILVSMPVNPILWLGATPLLDFFTSSLILVGLYRYIREWPNNYIKIILATLLVSSILYSLGGQVSLTMIIIPLYLIAATGLSFLITRWYRVFPRNPIPRLLGSILIVLALFVSVIYNTRSYFIAWPNNSKTAQQYTNIP